MLQMKIKTGRRSVVPGDLPSILGARRAYRELGDLIEVLIAQMDALAGDCDLEDGDLDVAVDDIGEIGDAYDIIPVYGPDQSQPWLNEEAMMRGGNAGNDRLSELSYQALLERRELDLANLDRFTAGASAELIRRGRVAA